MILQNLLLSLRQMMRKKLSTSINLLGLALGMMVSFYMGLYVLDELSYDRFHSDAEQLYRVAWQSSNPQTRTPHPMAQALVNDFAAVQAGVSITPVYGPGLSTPNLSVRYGEKRFDETAVYAGDTTFFEVFDFPVVAGDVRHAMDDPASVIITRQAAEKYFGKEDPIGQTLLFEERAPFKVTAVVENIPEQAHFHFDFLVPYTFFKAMETGEYYEWSDFGHFNYLKLAPGSDVAELEKQINDWSRTYVEYSDASLQALAEGTMGFRLQAITDIHLHSHLRWELEANNYYHYVLIMGLAALLILVVAVINFMNLYTARSLDRAKEVGIRKTVGGSRSGLMVQFVQEAILHSLLAFVLAVLLTEIAGPWLDSLSGKSLIPGLQGNLLLLLGLPAAAILIGVLAGIYPAWFLSGFTLTQVIRGKVKFHGSGKMLRRGLLTFQFAASAFLIISTGVIYEQVMYLKNQETGYESNGLLYVPLRNLDYQKISALEEALRQQPNIEAVSAATNIPGKNFNQNSIRWTQADPEQDLSVSEFRIDFHFLETMGIRLKEGRDFSREYKDQQGTQFLINESVARYYDWEDPLGQELIWFDDEAERRGTVVGIVEDFHYQSLHAPIQPAIYQVTERAFSYLLIRLGSGDVSESIAGIEALWKQEQPAFDFEVQFADQELAQLYEAEDRLGKLFFVFTLLAVLIACMGLFGLTVYHTEERTKEIGIRKVLGANTPTLVFLLSRQFLLLVGLAFLLACPIAWWVMRSWLQGFAYHIELSLLALLPAIALLLLPALLTMSVQVIRTARQNPVKSLRTE